jgi:hypothetical protein
MCEACVRAKATRQPYPKISRRNASAPLQRVWFDVIGKIPVEGWGGVRYVLVFVDEFTGMYLTTSIRKRSEVPQAVLRFEKMAERHWQGRAIFGTLCFSPQIAAFCSDGAGENQTNALNAILLNEGIKHETMTAHEHEQMGRVERAIRTIWEGAEAIRIHANWPASYWPTAVEAFVYVRNLLPNQMKRTDNLEAMKATPYELWHDIKRADFKTLTKHLRVVGCTAYAFVPKALRRRLDEKVVKAMFVGYSLYHKAYILESKKKKRFLARNVYFNESEFPKRKPMRKSKDYEREEDDILSKWSTENSVEQQKADEALQDDDFVPTISRNAGGKLEKGKEKFSQAFQDLSASDESDEGTDSSFPELDDSSDSEDSENSDHYDDYSNDEHSSETSENSDHEDESENINRKSMRKRRMSNAAIESMTNDPINIRRNEELNALTKRAKRREEKNDGARCMRITCDDEETDDVMTLAVAKAMLESRRMKNRKRPLRPLVYVSDYDSQESAESPATRADAKSNENYEELNAEMSYVTRIHGIEAPESRKAMLRHPNAKDFIAGERKEMDSFRRLRVLEARDISSLPANTNVMKCRWVYDVKRDLKGAIVYKARLVAKGFTQVHGVDYFDVFSPTMQLKTLRVLLALKASDAKIRSVLWDVSTAFLYADMEEDVYVEIPEGYAQGFAKTKCYKMLKSMYGTKQACRNWNRRVHEAMSKAGFVRSKCDACLYLKRAKNSFVYALVHVDDFGVFYNDDEMCEKVFDGLQEEFKMKKGPFDFFLGMHVNERTDGGNELSQTAYVDAILARYGKKDDTRTVKMPEVANLKLTKDQCPKSDEEREVASLYPYANVVGSLQYLVVGSRPDIAHAVSMLAQFMADPGVQHCDAADRVLCYLRGSRHRKLIFRSRGEGFVLDAFADADYAGCTDTRRSRSGYACKVNGTAVVWQSARQKCVSLSSCESEYIALCTCAKQVVWMRRLLSELRLDQKNATVIYCDNDAARQLTENPVHHERTKHIDTQYHYVREKYEAGELKVVRVDSIENEADVLTKEYVGPHFNELSDRLMGVTQWMPKNRRSNEDKKKRTQKKLGEHSRRAARRNATGDSGHTGEDIPRFPRISTQAASRLVSKIPTPKKILAQAALNSPRDKRLQPLSKKSLKVTFLLPEKSIQGEQDSKKQEQATYALPVTSDQGRRTSSMTSGLEITLRNSLKGQKENTLCSRKIKLLKLLLALKE